MRPINRLQPKLPVEVMKTYSIASPTETHTRAAECDEVDCDAHAGGWETLVNEATDLGVRQANYIRNHSARHFVESFEAGVTTFRFPPGEQCFEEHRVSLDRPQLYIVSAGDWRGYGKRRQHSGPDPWLNDFAEHQANLNKTING